MRVLHVIPSLALATGGPARALAALASAQAKVGADVAVLTTLRPGEELPSFATACPPGMRVAAVGPCYGPLRWRPGLSAAVRRAVADSDVVHVHALFEDIQHCAALWARRLGRPYIMRPAGMLDPWSMAQSSARKRVYMAWRLSKMLRRASAVHFTAEGERIAATRWTAGLPAIVEPNGIDFAEFDRLPPKDMIVGAGDAGPGGRLVFMSRVHHKKGLDLLIAAMARMRNKASLTIIGPGEPQYVAELERQAADAGVRERIEFRGPVYGEDRLRLLQDADLFVLPSRQENFGVAIVEALAVGTPVVISKAVNIWEEIVGANVGVAVDLDPRVLAETIDAWLDSPSRLADARSGAKAFVRARYEATAVARRWISHYEEIVRARADAEAAWPK